MHIAKYWGKYLTLPSFRFFTVGPPSRYVDYIHAFEYRDKLALATTVPYSKALKFKSFTHYLSSYEWYVTGLWSFDKCLGKDMALSSVSTDREPELFCGVIVTQIKAITLEYPCVTLEMKRGKRFK